MCTSLRNRNTAVPGLWLTRMVTGLGSCWGGRMLSRMAQSGARGRSSEPSPLLSGIVFLTTREHCVCPGMGHGRFTGGGLWRPLSSGPHQTDEKAAASLFGLCFLFYLKPLISSVCHSELTSLTIKSLVSLVLTQVCEERGQGEGASTTPLSL